MDRHRKNRVQLLTPVNNWRVFERNFRKFVQFDPLPLLNSEETWAVSSQVEKALDYIMNPEKTVEKPEFSPDAIAARKAVGDVIDFLRVNQ